RRAARACGRRPAHDDRGHAPSGDRGRRQHTVRTAGARVGTSRRTRRPRGRTMLTLFRRAASIAFAGTCLLLGAGGAGCASRRITPVQAPTRPLRAATLEEVVAAYDGYCKGLDTLSAKGDADVRDLRAGRARRMGVGVRVGGGGKLYMKGRVAVVTALGVTSDGSRFFFRIPSRKTVWTGSADAEPTGAEDEHAPYYALRPRDVVSAFL